MTTLRVAFAGTPDFARPALLALLASPHPVVGVLTRPDKPRGRGQRLAASPIKLLAAERSLPLSQPVTLRTEADRAALTSWRPDVLVVVAYGLILPGEVLELPALGCLNIHASLLPRWRGAAPIQRALLAGDKQTGVTIMRVDAGLDTGPILRQQAAEIAAMETGGSLHDRLASLGASALLEVLEDLAEKRAHESAQPAVGVTYAAKVGKAEARIDWSRDAGSIERQIRAFNPWPIAETSLQGEQLRIFAACAASGSGGAGSPQSSGGVANPESSSTEACQRALPGTIVAAGDRGLVVACGQGELTVKEVQRPGRRRVAASDFANSLGLTGQRLG
ncbi:MAG TPA: methionyl-tRNA formyltransferase [Steroidobacteraceae bacterium]